MWQATKQRRFPVNKSTWQVIVLIDSMVDVDWIYDSACFCEHFKREINKIKVPGQFYQPSHLYKAEEKNGTVEVWKYRHDTATSKELKDYLMYKIEKK